jgi:hypothetical protein
MQSVPITTNVVSSNPAHGEVYLIQHNRGVEILNLLAGETRFNQKKKGMRV